VPVCLPHPSAAEQDSSAQDLEQRLNFESEKGYLYLLASLKEYEKK